MTIVWWGPDFPDPSDYLLFGPGEKVGLRAGWKAGSAPDVAEIAKKAAVEIDQATRTKLYDEWQKKLNAEGPFTSLFQPAFSMASSKTLEPVEYNAMWTIDLTAICARQEVSGVPGPAMTYLRSAWYALPNLAPLRVAPALRRRCCSASASPSSPSC